MGGGLSYYAMIQAAEKENKVTSIKERNAKTTLGADPEGERSQARVNDATSTLQRGGRRMRRRPKDDRFRVNLSKEGEAGLNMSGTGDLALVQSSPRFLSRKRREAKVVFFRSKMRAD